MPNIEGISAVPMGEGPIGPSSSAQTTPRLSTLPAAVQFAEASPNAVQVRQEGDVKGTQLEETGSSSGVQVKRDSSLNISNLTLNIIMLTTATAIAGPMGFTFCLISIIIVDVETKLVVEPLTDLYDRYSLNILKKQIEENKQELSEKKTNLETLRNEPTPDAEMIKEQEMEIDKLDKWIKAHEEHIIKHQQEIENHKKG